MKLARSLGAENEQLRRARDLLLPRLVSGDIVLDDLDIPIEEAVA